jgi:uncharacterized membrane protein YeaQ/YmgE (transglycosylase-associated protein family)
MTFTLPGLVVLIVVAAIGGAVGKGLAGGGPGGLSPSTAFGFVGALLGPWAAQHFHLSDPFVLRVGGQPFPLLWSVVGAMLVGALLRLAPGQRRVGI